MKFVFGVSRVARKPSRSTRDRILQAAEQEFRKEGYEGASIRRIAEEAKLSTGAIYNLFKDKERLFEVTITPIRENMVLKWINAYEQTPSRHSLERMDREDAFKQEFGSVMRMIDFVFDNREDLQLIVYKALGSNTEDFLHDLAALGLLGEVCFGIVQFNKRDIDQDLLKERKNLLTLPIIKYYEWMISSCETKEEAALVGRPIIWSSLNGYLALKADPH